MGFGALALAAVVLVAGSACAPAREPASPDVLLVTVDTLRADHLGCYGSRATKTPNVDRLAAEGMLFERAASPLPETRPSHFTLFTSRYPRDHGLLSNAATFDREALTLADVYSRAGYRTAGFAACALFDAEAGADLGFGFFDPPETYQRAADEVVPRAIRWLESLGADDRFFLWLHLFDPHMPYQPPPPWNARGDGEMVEAWPEFAWPRLLETADANGGDIPAEVFLRAKELYAGEVEYADHWLGRLFSALGELGRWDEAVVALTADHGECFENGVFFDHSQCLGDGAIAVPLVLRHRPRIEAGRRVATQVELLDVAPTLLELSGLPVPETFGGRSLLARQAGATDDAYAFFQHPFYHRVDAAGRRDVLARLRSVAGEPTRAIAGDRLQVGAVGGGWKYLRRGTKEELYHLADDPEENVDLVASEGERLARFRVAVRRWLREHPVRFDPDADVDPKLREQLEALGYL